MNKYLPSKKFTIWMGIGIAVIAGVFLISRFSTASRFISEKKLRAEKVTLNDLWQKDTDGDGVMDWEEGLWGTDVNKAVTFDGEPDSSYIRKRREALPAGDTAGMEGTETEKFAQEFFTSFVALKQNGQFDEKTINNLYGSIGEKIADPSLLDRYTSNNVKLSEETGVQAQAKYYDTLQGLFEKYAEAGIGDELEAVSGDITTYSSTGETNSESRLSGIADAYQEFASKMSEMSVPSSLVSHHLKIMNDANNTGVAVRNMEKMVTDPIIGLSGLSQYQKYSDDLIKAARELQAILENNGIITE